MTVGSEPAVSVGVHSTGRERDAEQTSACEPPLVIDSVSRALSVGAHLDSLPPRELLRFRSQCRSAGPRWAM